VAVWESTLNVNCWEKVREIEFVELLTSDCVRVGEKLLLGLPEAVKTSVADSDMSSVKVRVAV